MFPLYTLFWWVFITNGRQIFVKCLLWVDLVGGLYSFHSFFKVIYSIDLQMLKHPFICEINPTWLCCMILLRYCLIWFANILLRTFASTFMKDIGLQFYFLVMFLLTWHKMNIEIFPLFLFPEELERNWYYSLNIW